MSRVIILPRSKPCRKASVPKTKEEFCIGCGICTKVGPKGIIRLVTEEVLPGVTMATAKTLTSLERIAVKNPSKVSSFARYCVGCQRCVEECPTGARMFL